MPSLPKFRQLSQYGSATDSDWYEHPVLLATFLVFLFLFVFSIYALTSTGSLIRKGQDMTKADFEEMYGQSITQIETAYVINTVILIFSLLVVMYFLSKLIKLESTIVLINDYVGIVFLLFIIFASSYNINTFNSVKNSGTASSVSSVSIVLVVIASIGVLFLSLKTYRNHKHVASETTQVKKQVAVLPKQKVQ